MKRMPGIQHLLDTWEREEDLHRMTTEDILMKWVNYHLKNARSARRINNFKSDLCDSEVYAILLNRVSVKLYN